MEEINKKEYEISFLIKEESDVEIIKKLMQSYGMEITEGGELRRFALPYKIKKETSAVFGYFHFMSEPDKIKEFSDSLKVEKECLRSMIVSDPVKKQEDTRREENREDKKTTKKVEIKEDEKSLTNEELEKKLEEILK